MVRFFAEENRGVSALLPRQDNADAPSAGPHDASGRTLSRFPIPDSRIPNPESRIPNPESRIPNPESRIIRRSPPPHRPAPHRAHPVPASP
ncbi:hypothetical protein CIW71_14940 [Xanthomonas citri pv. malvacearum]|nr:hypothetical protein CIW71_14940 [Xanthomonas citri pv. malvacearum]